MMVLVSNGLGMGGQEPDEANRGAQAAIAAAKTKRGEAGVAGHVMLCMWILCIQNKRKAKQNTRTSEAVACMHAMNV
jgi:hypothetical protein